MAEVLAPDPATADAADALVPGPEFCVPRATIPRPVPKRARLDDPTLYFNRELSWLDFNWRVLYQALDERTPLLERVRFLCIAASNLDEFFRKRVGGLKRQFEAGVSTLTPDGRTPAEQLALGRRAAAPMYRTLTETWEYTLKPLLRDEIGIHIHDYADLDEEEQARLNEYFHSHIFPILTPLAVDPGHPFPFISDLSLSLAIVLRHPKRDTEHFARVKVPAKRGRWLPLSEKNHFVPVEQVIRHNLHELFRGMEIESAHLFRITRNVEVEREEEETADLLEAISEELRERRFAPVVRLEVEEDMPAHVRDLLREELGLSPDDLYECSGMMDLTNCNVLANLNAPAEASYGPWEPVTPVRLKPKGEDRTIFGAIRERDLLVHHPYESFRASVQRFVEEAARDEKVLAIKQTLYRTSEESPIIKALVHAAEEGKQVAVLVEVKARFDEENNIEWGQELEKAGVHVTYGLVGLKTHCKVTLVVREEDDGLRAYCHLGTGNYNHKTARFYTDVGIFTCKPEVGNDIVNLFHYLTGFAPEQHYGRLLVAPREMRRGFIELVQHEINRQKKSGDGRIIAKMNALDDVEMIQEIYRASQAGVQVDLIVRGHCRLRPGLERYSENVRVISIIGRFLEHSRIYQFGPEDDARVFLGSADWQRRNLDDRVETIVEVDDPENRARLLRTLQLALEDERQAWDLAPDGTYTQRRPSSPEKAVGFQDMLMERVRRRATEAGTPWDIS